MACGAGTKAGETDEASQRLKEASRKEGFVCIRSWSAEDLACEDYKLVNSAQGQVPK